MAFSNKKTQIKPQEEQPPEHAFTDTTNRFSVDQLLRKSHFRIHARPAKSEAIWERCSANDVPLGIYLPQSEAIKELDFSELHDAVYAENLYRDGFPE